MTQLLQGGSALAPQHRSAPDHHPALETLAEYSAGHMRAGFDFVIAAHLRGCARCRDDVAQLEAVGGGLLQSISPARLDDHALATTLARLDEPAPPPARDGKPARSLDQLLAGARRRWIAPGIWIAPIDTPHDSDDRVFLLRVGPGRATAPHSHHGMEMTQVLEGAVSDGGVIYRAGDLIELDDSHSHHPQVAGDEPCICLFATNGRLKPTTLIGRVAFALAGV